jgi:hypothetical protein
MNSRAAIHVVLVHLDHPERFNSREDSVALRQAHQDRLNRAKKILRDIGLNDTLVDLVDQELHI